MNQMMARRASITFLISSIMIAFGRWLHPATFHESTFIFLASITTTLFVYSVITKADHEE